MSDEFLDRCKEIFGEEVVLSIIIEIILEEIPKCTRPEIVEERMGFVKPHIQAVEDKTDDGASAALLSDVFDGFRFNYTFEGKCIEDDPAACYCCSLGFARVFGQKTKFPPVFFGGCWY